MQLPVFVSKDNRAEVIAERQDYLLFDRMVAFHVQHGVTVPLSAAEFYAGLEQRFPRRDGMYFLPDQVAEYDKRRMTIREVLQLQLFVSDDTVANSGAFSNGWVLSLIVTQGCCLDPAAADVGLRLSAALRRRSAGVGT